MEQKNNPYQPFESFDELFEQAENRPSYKIELAKHEFTEELFIRMRELNITKGELAKRLDAKPGLVTRLLNGKNNFEIATMVRLAVALESDFRCHLQPRDTKTFWINVLKEKPLQILPSNTWDPQCFTPLSNEQCFAFAA